MGDILSLFYVKFHLKTLKTIVSPSMTKYNLAIILILKTFSCKICN